MSVIKGNCEICETEIEITRCCSGWGCGCGGGPVDPPVCSDECFDKLVEKAQAEREQKEKQEIIEVIQEQVNKNYSDELPF